MKKTILVSAISLFFAYYAANSYAYTISFGGTSTSNSVITTSNSWATVYDFETSLGAMIEGNYKIVFGSSSGNWAAPAIGSNTDVTNYLTVGPYSSGTGNLATITFSSDNNYLGLFWGSMDSYNEISFYDSGSLVFSLDGNQVSAYATANGNQQASETNRYVNIYTDNLLFDTIILSSSSMAFEVDNLAVGTSPVPEPATLFLFGSGLLGLARLMRRKNA